MCLAVFCQDVLKSWAAIWTRRSPSRYFIPLEDFSETLTDLGLDTVVLPFLHCHGAGSEDRLRNTFWRQS